MGTVTIAGVSPDPSVYVTNLAAATNYVTGRFGTTYTAWLALVSDDKGRTLVSATDFMDRLSLKDPATGAAIAYSSTIPAINNACCELAVLIADDPDVVAQFDAGSNIKKVNAGGAGVEFFVPTSPSDGSGDKLPHVIQQLLSPYLSGNASVAVIGGYGQAGDCDLDDVDGGDLDRNWPF
jgi:hypothetical protein